MENIDSSLAMPVATAVIVAIVATWFWCRTGKKEEETDEDKPPATLYSAPPHPGASLKRDSHVDKEVEKILEDSKLSQPFPTKSVYKQLFIDDDKVDKSFLEKLCSSDGFIGPMARLPTLHVVDNIWQCRGWDVEVRQMFQPLGATELRKLWELPKKGMRDPFQHLGATELRDKFKGERFIWKGPHIQKTRYGSPLKSPALAGYTCSAGIRIIDIFYDEANAKREGMTDARVLKLNFEVVDLPSWFGWIWLYLHRAGIRPQPALRYEIFVELNIHRPKYYDKDAKEYCKRPDISMFGETFQCGALLKLVPSIGVIVVLGNKTQAQARKQIAFLKSIDPERVSSSTKTTMNGRIKLRLDQLTPFLADKFKEAPKGTCDSLRETFISSAKACIQALGTDEAVLLRKLLLIGAEGKESTQTEESRRALLDVKDLPKPMVMIQNRCSETKNCKFLDLLDQYLVFLLQICSLGGVKTVIFNGDPIFELSKTKQLIEAEQGSIQKFVYLNKVYHHPSFKAEFGAEAFISGQAWLNYALKPHLAAVLGPHSGATEFSGLLGIPTIIFTPYDHTSHPRITRLAYECREWWKFIGCGTCQELKKKEDLSDEGKQGVCIALEECLSNHARQDRLWQEYLQHRRTKNTEARGRARKKAAKKHLS